jgi:hypothetical protein
MTQLTIKRICAVAGAVQLTQHGNLQAMKYASLKDKDAPLVVNELRATEFCTKEAIFIYPKGTVSYTNKEVAQ